MSPPAPDPKAAQTFNGVRKKMDDGERFRPAFINFQPCSLKVAKLSRHDSTLRLTKRRPASTIKTVNR